MVYKVMWRNMLPIKPETLGRTPSLYDNCTGFFYMNYTKLWDLGLYVPPEGCSNNGCVRLASLGLPSVAHSGEPLTRANRTITHRSQSEVTGADPGEPLE